MINTDTTADYDIITAPSILMLRDAVRTACATGKWKPCGGPFAIFGDSGKYVSKYGQAVTR